jgi:glycosyltransferase involved in cell wall biosynthesis
MPPLRVLLFTTRLGGGGAEAQALRLANQLDPRDLAVELAVCRAGGEYEAELAPHVPLHHLAPAVARSSTAALVAAIRPLRRLVRARRPDVVCAFMDGPNVAAAIAVARTAAAPRLVACVQNTISQELTRGRHPVKRVVMTLARYVYPRVDAIVALSHGVAADLVEFAPRAAERVTIIHNAGLDDRLADLAAAPLDGDLPRPRGPLIVACGRLTAQKGYGDLLDGFGAVHAATGAHLWILGEGGERAALERRITARGLGAAVRLLGFRRNPYRYMAAADLFVLSSIYEGFGNVIVEAMATGTPVVSTNCPHGPGEIIRDGVTGLLVPVGDPPALAAAMIRVLRDPALAATLAAAGLRRAQDFHIAAIAAQYEALFRRVASS